MREMRFVYYDYEDGGLMFPRQEWGAGGFNRVKETWLWNLISSLYRITASRLVMETII